MQLATHMQQWAWPNGLQLAKIKQLSNTYANHEILTATLYIIFYFYYNSVLRFMCF